MITRRNRDRGAGFRLVGAVLLLALSSGCSTTGSARNPYEEGPERSFDAAGGRVPSSKTLHTMARILAGQGNDPQCEIVLQKLIASHPRYAPAHNELAELYMRQGRPDRAEQVIELGLEQSPKDGVLLNNLGMSQLMQGRLGDALASFTRAAEAHPYDRRARSNMATTLALLGRREEAEALYLQVTSRSNAYRNLARLCAAAGEEDRASQYLALAQRYQN